MEKNLNLMVDVDDTLASTQDEILKYVNERLVEKEYKYQDLTAAHREKKDDDAYAKLVQEWLRKPELVAKSKPFQGALDAFRKLHEHGFILHIASSRKENLHHVTENWLQEHGFIDYVHEIHGRHSKIDGDDFKVGVANRIKPLAIFDDTASVANTLSDAGHKVYLINAPWNSDVVEQEKIIRCASFAEAVDKFLAS